MPDNSCHPRDRPHDGVDFGPASIGSDVIASADGVVLSVADDRDAGTEVVVAHDDSPLDHASKRSHYRTGYAHLQHTFVKPRDRVVRGQVIGEVGVFPALGGIPHVHWRLWGSGEMTDPVSRTVGCFDRKRHYSGSTFELTFPLAC